MSCDQFIFRQILFQARIKAYENKTAAANHIFSFPAY